MNPSVTMEAISQLYHLKDNSNAKPTTYLGAQVIKFTLPDDKSKLRWGFSSHQYIAEAIKNVELELAKIDEVLSNSVSTPLSSGSDGNLTMNY